MLHSPTSHRTKRKLLYRALAPPATSSHSKQAPLANFILEDQHHYPSHAISTSQIHVRQPHPPSHHKWAFQQTLSPAPHQKPVPSTIIASSWLLRNESSLPNKSPRGQQREGLKHTQYTGTVWSVCRRNKAGEGGLKTPAQEQQVRGNY